MPQVERAMNARELPEAFARALVQREFDAAASMLSAALRVPMAGGLLQDEFDNMISYAEGSAINVELMVYESEWPTMQPGDVAWAYVAVWGDGFSEAVSVVLANEHAQNVIRSIEWGRP